VCHSPHPAGDLPRVPGHLTTTVLRIAGAADSASCTNASQVFKCADELGKPLERRRSGVGSSRFSVLMDEDRFYRGFCVRTHWS
jgi:hypothetical protein